jgi:hypothetical protein
MAYKIVSTIQKGRALFANKLIKENEAILQEEPLISCQFRFDFITNKKSHFLIFFVVFSWNKEYKYLACEHCLKPLESAQDNVRRLGFDANIQLPFPEADEFSIVEIIYCENCLAPFCSLECKIKAYDQYHKLLCNETIPGGKFYEINEIWK